MNSYGVPVVIRDDRILLAGVDLTPFVPMGVVELTQDGPGQWTLRLTVMVVPE